MTPCYFSPLCYFLISLLFIIFTFSLLYCNHKLDIIIVFPIMMISFCRKITPHYFLGLTTTTTTTTTTSIDAHEKLPLKCHNYMSPSTSSTRSGGRGGLLGLVTPTNYDHIKHQPLVLESSSIKSSSSSSSSSSDSSSPPSPPPPAIEFETKKDPGAFGFIDDIGGGVDGLMSCTESLGFESSDERRVDDHQIVEGVSHLHANEDDKDYHEEDACLRMMRHSMKRVSKCTGIGERRVLEAKKFPPPLSSLNQNGQPSYYLRPVRKDGRLELTEVRIYRPEILRAYRQDGRLRLHLVSHEPLQEEEEPLEGIEEVEEDEEIEQVVIDEEAENRINVVKKEEEERVGGAWKLTVGGEGFRRCHNLVSRHHVHHHHSNLAVWNQQQHCVTTR